MGRGSKIRSRGLPPWHKGKLIRDDITGTWEGSRSGKILRQRGLNVTKESFDYITDEQRVELERDRLNR